MSAVIKWLLPLSKKSDEKKHVFMAFYKHLDETYGAEKKSSNTLENLSLYKSSLVHLPIFFHSN